MELLASISGRMLATVDDHINTGLMEALAEDYQQVNECPTDYVKDLGAGSPSSRAAYLL